MDILHSVFGYVILLAIAWLVGTRQSRVPWRIIGVATGLQLALTAGLLLTSLRVHIFGVVGNLTSLLQTTSQKAGQSLLFIGVSNPEFTSTYGPIIALEIAAIIIFVASLSRVLYHYGILPWVIGRLSRFMQRIFGLSAAESVGVAANVFLGMTEAPLLITVMVVYASMLSGAHPEIAGHLFTASVISAPAAIAVAKLMLPETEQPQTAGTQIKLESEETLNGLDAAARGASEGMHLFLNILAMLIAFIGLVALTNTTLGWIGEQLGAGAPWTLQATAGWLFRLPCWLMGVSWSEAGIIGELMGVKTILNEFVAYLDLSTRMRGPTPGLSGRAFLIAIYAMCGFANFGSVAIMIGGIGGIAPDRRGDLARLGMRSIVAGTLATMLTGCVVGLFV